MAFTDKQQSTSFAAALGVWLKIGLLSFGGPAAQIALMHRELVQQRGWLSESQFINGLGFCMLLPGPEAMQLVTYSGWRMAGIKGGLAAGLLFVIPGALIIMLLAACYVTYGDVPAVNAMFNGIKAAVLIIVIEALLRIAKRTVNTTELAVAALVAFIGIFFFQVSFPLIVIGAALYGYFRSSGHGTQAINIRKAQWHITARTIIIWLVIWWTPVLLLWVSGQQFLTEIAISFSKLAIVTFGGAYAVLAYMAQDVVSGYGWLASGEMMDGLGLAETTPGPLILVTEFVAYVAGYKIGGAATAVAAAVAALWVTFVPCFLWIFAGAPFIEWLSEQPRLKSALKMVTAAVVGVMLNLSIWFGLHVLFTTVNASDAGPLTLWVPDVFSFEWRIALLATLAAFLLLVRKWNVIAVLGVTALGGLLLY
jgi:chromate transporter